MRGIAVFVFQTIFTAIIGLFVVWTTRRINQVHTLVNSKMSDALAKIALLEQEVAGLRKAKVASKRTRVKNVTKD